jgi:hypothetical protein
VNAHSVGGLSAGVGVKTAGRVRPGERWWRDEERQQASLAPLRRLDTRAGGGRTACAPCSTGASPTRDGWLVRA